MTALTAEFLTDWAAHPIGKVTRVLIGGVGVILSTLVLLLAAFGTQNVWIPVLVGIALAATSIRAAMLPNALRLVTLAVVLLAIPSVAELI